MRDDSASNSGSTRTIPVSDLRVPEPTTVRMIGISANTIPPAGRPFQLRPKYLLFGLVGLMVLTVLYRDRVLMNSQAPLWDHYRYFKWWLLPHGIAGALALLLGPLQFSQRLRKRFLPRHRIAGRVYVGESQLPRRSAYGSSTSNTRTPSLRYDSSLRRAALAPCLRSPPRWVSSRRSVATFRHTGGG